MRTDATVYIAEIEDFDDWSILTGRFTAHVESDDDLYEEIEEVSADEAIAWGRERAAVVLIRTGESDYYSAGAENPHDLPEWPPPDLHLGRRRMKGFEAMDNGKDDAPVLWDVRVSADMRRLARSKPFRQAVRDHPAALEVKAPAPGYPRASACFLVETATFDQAQAIAGEVFQGGLEALHTARLTFQPRSGVGIVGGFEVYPHRPGEPVTGPGIRH